MAFWFTLFLWVASFVISDYFRARLPAQTPSGLGDFTVPTATEGRYVPLCFGTMIVQGPNVVWYGDFVAEERTVETGIIFKDDETIGFTYKMAMQLGLVRGKTAGVRRIWVGDDIVWDYAVDNGGVPGSVCDVDRADLFGGTDQGGGFVGRFRLFDGDPLQGFSAYLQTQDITNLPAYRGFSYLLLTNVAEDGGANMGEANIVRNFKFELQMMDTVANGALGDALNLGNDHHIIGDDLNPVSLAYQVFTDTDWGRALSPSDLNLSNFQAAAETIFAEGLGFSNLIDSVQTTADLIDTIEQHIDGYIGPNPLTGQIEVLLARQDYTLASEFQADETNIESVTKFSRGENNQTFNEVLLQYTDRLKDYNDGYAPAQDLANLIIQGRPKSKTIRYQGVHDPAVANKIVWRDIRGFSRSLASATVEVNRTAWNLRPGAIISLTDAEANVVNMPFRITAVRQGDPLNATIVLDVVEDIFGVEEVGFADPPDSEFVPPTQAVFPFLLADMLAVEAPYIINQQHPSTPTVFPRMFVGARDGGVGTMSNYEVKRRTRTPPTGFSGLYTTNGFVSGGTMTVGVLRNAETGWKAGNGTFTVQIDPIAGSLDDLIDSYAPGGVGQMRGVAVINPNTANEEWIAFNGAADLVTSPESAGSIELNSVYRACMDSQMEAHSPGERVWFIWTGGTALPDEQFTVADAIDPKFLPQSATDSISETDSPEPVSAAEVQLDADARYLKPLLPVDLKFNDISFPTGDVDFDGVVEGSPISQGVEVIPTHRSFRTKDIIWSVTGLDQLGGELLPADIENGATISWYLFDLDDTPSPVRGTDEIDSGIDIPILSGVDPFTMAKSVIAASRSSNSFNARIEVLTKHNPFGFTELSPARESREVLQFDFTAIGTFIVPRSAIFFQLVTEGEVGSRRYRDVSDSNYRIESLGNPVTELVGSPEMKGLNTANSFPDASFRSNLLLIEDVFNPKSGRDFEMNQDWTIEVTLSWNATAGFEYIFNTDQTSGDALNGEIEYENGVRWWYIAYVSSQDRFSFAYASTQGGSYVLGANFSATGDFVPVVGQTYHLMFTRKDNGDGTLTFAVFIDGVKTTTPQTVSDFTIFNYRDESPIRIAYMTMGRSQTFRNLGHSTASGLNARIDAVRIVLGFALEAIDYTTDSLEFPVRNTLSLLISTDVEGDDSVNPLISSDGYEIAVAEAASNGVVLTDSPFPAESPEVLYPAWDCTGVNSLNPLLTGAPYVGTISDDGDFQIAFDLGDSDWQMEAWIKFRTLPSANAATHNGSAIISKYNRAAGNTVDWLFQIDSNDRMEFRWWDGGNISSPQRVLQEDIGSPEIISPAVVSPQRYETDVWYHVAVVRNGDALSLHKDGVRIAHDATHFLSGASSPNIGPISNDSNNPIGIGRVYDANTIGLMRCLDGFITDARVLLETFEYDGPTYTVPTEPHSAKRGTVIANTKGTWEDHVSFLANWDDPGSPLTQATDYGNIGFTIFFNGIAAIDTAIFKYGTGSLDCRQGSPVQSGANFCAIVDDPIWDFDLKDFTLETWVRFNSLPAAGEIATFVSQWDGPSSNAAWRFGYHGDNGFFGALSTGNETTNMVQIDEGSVSPEPALNTWIHVRFTRRNLWSKLFVDGVQVAEGLMGVNPTNEPETVLFGCSHDVGNQKDFFDGWMDDTQIAIGHAKDDNQEFTPERNLMSHTVFQLGYENDGFNGDIRLCRDDSKSGLTFQNGSNYAWNAFPFMRRTDPDNTGEPISLVWKGVSTARVEFDGSTGVNLDSGDFTIEFWFMWNNGNHLTGSEALFSHYAAGANRSWTFQYEGVGGGGPVGSPNINNQILKFYWSHDGNAQSALGYQWIESPDLFTWHHIAVVREVDELRLYIDGTFRPWDVFWDSVASPDAIAAGSPSDQFFPSQSPGGIHPVGASGDVTVGSLYAGTSPSDASFEGMRVLKGIALYDANFTPRAKWPRI